MKQKLTIEFWVLCIFYVVLFLLKYLYTSFFEFNIDDLWLFVFGIILFFYFKENFIYLVNKISENIFSIMKYLFYILFFIFSINIYFQFLTIEFVQNLSIFLCILGIIIFLRNGKIDKKNIINDKYNILYKIFLIVIISILIGYIFWIQDTYMWTDEFFSFYLSKMIFQNGNTVFELSGLEYNRALFYHYTNAFFMILFGRADEFTSRISNILFLSITSVFIYRIINQIISKKKSVFGLLGVILFLILNITLANSRETRFYIMFGGVYLVSLYTYYNAFINKNITDRYIKIFNLKFEYNLFWALCFIISFYVSYRTQLLTFCFILSLFIYYLFIIFKYKKYRLESIFLCFSIFLFIIFSFYYRYNSFNMHDNLFYHTTVMWARSSPLNTEYYTNFIRNNLYFYIPFIFSLIFLVKKNKLYDLLYCNFFVGLFFVSNQRAIQERYVYFLIPIVIILVSMYIYYFFHFFKKQKIIFILFTIVFVFLFYNQALLFYKEINYKDYMQEENVIFRHKKLDFDLVFDFIKENNFDTKIISDHHSLYTLFSKDIESNYSFLPFNSYKLIFDNYRRLEVYEPMILNEPYLNIPYLEHRSQNYFYIYKNFPIIIILRDLGRYPNIGDELYRIDYFNRPYVYVNQKFLEVNDFEI